MSERDCKQFPAWAQRERASDLVWIGENLRVFWSATQQGYQEQGRGAIVVDTTSQPTGGGHPFAYLPEGGIDWGFVTTLFKSQDRLSTFRVGIPSQNPATGTRS